MSRLKPNSKTKQATNVLNLTCFTVIQASEESNSVLLRSFRCPTLSIICQRKCGNQKQQLWDKGCDQQHEEEMDSETIYKNFVLRVMAARSPNVRLRKALNISASSSKYPLSAPPKSSKSRLAVIFSISQKTMEDKKKVVKPLLKHVSTPTITKAKPVAAKYLTTPRNKNSPKNQKSFRSVRNPKSTAIEVPKNRMVAKALVFHSPKKAIKVKTSVELRTPLTKLRERTKRVEITSQRKHIKGYSNQSSKKSQNQEAKSLRSVKSKGKVQLLKPSTPKELEENGCRNLDINQKSRSGATSDILRINDVNQDKQHTMGSAISGQFKQQKSTQVDTCLSSAALPLTNISDISDLALSDDSGGETNGLLIAEERLGDGSNSLTLKAPNREDNGSNNGDKHTIIKRDFALGFWKRKVMYEDIFIMVGEKKNWWETKIIFVNLWAL
ncbi:Uncharacterized protein Adt_14992 [Abeliophyllum distichum]|uniref:Uncharacterized protein n=1 Tax=Abeliophyllum distichum TaxID=126358 RepID=A0ABD1U175_9LAMI